MWQLSAVEKQGDYGTSYKHFIQLLKSQSHECGNKECFKLAVATLANNLNRDPPEIRDLCEECHKAKYSEDDQINLFQSKTHNTFISNQHI